MAIFADLMYPEMPSYVIRELVRADNDNILSHIASIICPNSTSPKPLENQLASSYPDSEVPSASSSTNFTR